MPKPSIAQTRLLILLWLEDKAIRYIQETDPTVEVLVREQWIVPNGKETELPNGRRAPQYVLSQAGLDAAKDGFREATLRQ